MNQTEHEWNAVLQQVARDARREPTQTEKALWEMLRKHRCGGLHFRRQVIVGPFRLDFYCAAAHLAIEVDGGVHAEASVQRRDAERQGLLEDVWGIHFLRLSNEDVLQHPDATRRRILTAVHSAEG